MKYYYTLKEILDNHSAADLKKIGKCIRLKGYYNMKKDELIAALSDYILDEHNLEESFLTATDKEIEAFEEALKGKKATDDPFLYSCWEDLFLAFMTLEGEVDIPLEVKDQYLRLKKLKKYQEAREKNRTIHSYALACSNLYSVIDVSKLVEIINSQTSLAVDSDEVINWCIRRASRDSDSMYFYENSYIIDEYYGGEAATGGMNYEEMLKLQEGKPYYLPNREELLRYADDLYVEENEAFNNMFNYLRTKMKIAVDDAYDYCAHIQLRIRCASLPNEVLQDCEKAGLTFHNKKQVEGFMKCFAKMLNNTRLPENRGYTAEEISSIISDRDKACEHSGARNTASGYDNDSNVIAFPQGKNDDVKISRNSPCPCGSGKKYKKCCGSN